MRKEVSVKKHADTMFFYTAICARASQIAWMAEEKSPSRISLRPVAYAPERGKHEKARNYF